MLLPMVPPSSASRPARITCPPLRQAAPGSHGSLRRRWSRPGRWFAGQRRGAAGLQVTDSARTASTTPACARISSVPGCSAVARAWCGAVCARSITRALTPWRASSMAASSPTVLPRWWVGQCPMAPAPAVTPVSPASYPQPLARPREPARALITPRPAPRDQPTSLVGVAGEAPDPSPAGLVGLRLLAHQGPPWWWAVGDPLCDAAAGAARRGRCAGSQRGSLRRSRYGSRWVVVGGPQVHRAGDQGRVAADLGAVVVQQQLRSTASSMSPPAMFHTSACSAPRAAAQPSVRR